MNMKVEEIKKWINSSKPEESIIYHTGHLAEERNDIEIREKAAQEAKKVIENQKPLNCVNNFYD